MKTPQSILLCGVCAVKTANSGPSSAARTHGLLVPNQARYQLRYTRIFNFCHYTTAEGKIKDFSVCGHSCGQSRFYAAFSNRGKSRKHRCRKALRRFTLPCPGYRHGTPKAGALPTALHPVISLFYPAGRILPQKPSALPIRPLPDACRALYTIRGEKATRKYVSTD